MNGVADSRHPAIARELVVTCSDAVAIAATAPAVPSTTVENLRAWLRGVAESDGADGLSLERLAGVSRALTVVHLACYSYAATRSISDGSINITLIERRPGAPVANARGAVREVMLRLHGTAATAHVRTVLDHESDLLSQIADRIRARCDPKTDEATIGHDCA